MAAFLKNLFRFLVFSLINILCISAGIAQPYVTRVLPNDIDELNTLPSAIYPTSRQQEPSPMMVAQSPPPADLSHLLFKHPTGYEFQEPSWNNVRLVVTLGGGAAFSSDVGSNKTFPIENPVTDEFYRYSANRKNHTSAIFNSFLGAEWRFNDFGALQMGFDYYQTGTFHDKGTLLQGADSLSENLYRFHYDIVTRQVLVEGKLLWTYHRPYLHPYILVGIGAAYNTAENYHTNVPPFLTFTREYNSNHPVSFTYAVGFGVDADYIPDRVRFGVGYRFSNLGQVKLGNAKIDTIPVSGSLTQNHLYANEVFLQITVLFSRKDLGS